jgi:hypothetical protein
MVHLVHASPLARAVRADGLVFVCARAWVRLSVSVSVFVCTCVGVGVGVCCGGGGGVDGNWAWANDRTR